MTRVLFMGRKQVAADALTWLSEQVGVAIIGVLTDDQLEISPTREAAISRGISVLDFDQTSELIRNRGLSYDLGLSMLYWKKLTGPFLDGAPLGNVNFHPAPLPEYKGTAGYNLAILEGRQTWAATAHYMDENIDTGGIIEVDEFPIDANTETAQSLELKCRPVLLDLFKRTVAVALSANARLPTSPNIGGKHISRRQMEEMKLIKDDDDVDRKIRAFWFPPYDGACMNIKGKQYTLVNRQILESLADPTSSSLFSIKQKD